MPPPTTENNDNLDVYQFHQNNKTTNATHHINPYESTNDKQHRQDEISINTLRTILKRPSDKKGTQTKRITFNPKVAYREPETYHGEGTPTDDEEDSHVNLQTDDEQTIEVDTNDDDTTNKQTENTTINTIINKDIPCTHTQEDIDNIPDIIDANNVNTNLNDAQLPYLNAHYGESYMKQTRQPSLITHSATRTLHQEQETTKNKDSQRQTPSR